MKRMCSVCVATVSLALLALFPLAGQAQKRDPHPALNEPDKFAWQLFVQLNHPADLTASRGTPDRTKPLGAAGQTVWETWKLARTEVFLRNGCKPPDWDAPAPEPRAVAANRALIARVSRPADVKLFDPPKYSEDIAQLFRLTIDEDPLASPRLRLATRLAPIIPPAVDVGEIGNETRMNRATFEFIVNKRLYNAEGQEKFFQDGLAVDFDKESIEAKAVWRMFSDEELRKRDELPKKFHTAFALVKNETTGADELKLFGLVALHIITKDIPNWFWTTFEHKDNPVPEVSSLDRYSDPDKGFPPEVANTVWQNYRLRGTQVDFVTSTGRPTLLGNTQIEGTFQASSSCITCHSRASIGQKPASGQRPSRISVFEDIHAIQRFPTLPATHAQNCIKVNPQDTSRCLESRGVSIIKGAIGAPDKSLYIIEGTPGLEFTQLDFVWSLRRARRRDASCPND